MARAEVTIGDTRFYLRTFNPREQLRIFGDLQKELLPSLGTILAAAAARTDDKSGDLDSGAILSAIRSFSSSLDGRGLDAWCTRLINKDLITFERSGAEAQKLDPNHIDVAVDDFSQILELLFEIIKLNFAGPLVRWLDLSGSGLAGAMGGLLGDSSQTSSANS